MAESQFEGYSVGKQTIPLRENFGSARVYGNKAQSVLNKATGFISAYDFTLNPYRGCQYGCSYCYAAAFSPNPQMREDWGNWVIVKENAPLIVEKELANWYQKNPDRVPSIYMSSVTDPYQPIEAKEQLTRRLLEVMVKYQPILVIQTRSPMITRDIDILREFHHLRINISIPTGSEKVRRDFEPRSSSITSRLQAVAKLRYNIPCNHVHDVRFSITITPLLPTLEEDEAGFIPKLEIVDRVVIQDFHPANARSLVASTRSDAIDLKQKYSWWYNQERESYQRFKRKLTAMLPSVQIMEGKTGFGYD
jgi:DNA repair photolyase